MARRNGRAPAADVHTMAGMNVVMFITDQERAIQHFPPGWAKKNLPGLTRLQRHGLTFERAFTNSCMCSPARATLMTGYFPAQHGVKYTLETDMPGDQYPQVEMPVHLPNLASVMSAAGYTLVYKGKWHLSKPLAGGDDWAPRDVERYGFSRWNPPDAGANQDVSEAGGGDVDNDGRFVEEVGADAAGNEGALQYLRSRAARQQPFFMIISLVNPHDVLLYPKTYTDAGYTDAWLRGDIGLPATVDEDLSTKPDVQAQFLELFSLTGPLVTDDRKRDYLNFYGNLMKSSDSNLVQVLDTLEEQRLLRDTVVIRTSDHGEMGLAHGGLRQKNFNFYEESLRIPLVFSNPRLFPRPRRSEAMVSHVDLLPTLATLCRAPEHARADWQGVDYADQVLHPEAARPPQEYVIFTWDDWQAGQANGPYLPPPNHIESIREQRWKLARYYDTDGGVRPQWEMYDLLNDPLERTNLAWKDYRRSLEQQVAFVRLQRKLARIRKTRLHPLPTTREAPTYEDQSAGSSHGGGTGRGGESRDGGRPGGNGRGRGTRGSRNPGR